MDKLISIIIPVFNVEKYISDCINSVLLQPYKNIEIICIDDCGQDNSIRIVSNFASLDSRIKIIHHSQNKGLGPARNTGINASSGDYILFLDSDDMLYPNALCDLVDDIERTNADIIVGRVVAFPHVNDREICSFAKRYNKYDQRVTPGLYKLYFERIPQECLKISEVAPGRLFKKNFISKNNLYFIDKNIMHEDNGFFIKYLSCLPTISILNKNVIKYRIRSKSIMTQLKGKEFFKRRHVHICQVLNDARKYVYSKYDRITANILLCQLGKLESPSFIFDYGNLFQLKWHKNEKIIRIFRIPIYRERINCQQYKVYSLLCIPIFKKKIYLNNI